LSSSAVWNPVAAMPGNLSTRLPTRSRPRMIRSPDHAASRLAVHHEPGRMTVSQDGPRA
jgi:hypothetical protein